MPYRASAVIQQVVQALVDQHNQLSHQLYGETRANGTARSPVSPPIVTKIELLVQVANGEINRANAREILVGQVSEAVQLVSDLLTTAPGITTNLPVPEAFWDTPIGQVIARAEIWLLGDDLISIRQAARLRYAQELETGEMTIHSIERRINLLIEQGDLRAYRDFSISNPQHRKRVLRSAVLTLRK